jgi:WD40 repeat protein
MDETKKTELHQLLDRYYNDDELRTLCLYLSIDYDNLPGQTKNARMRELILWCERHGRLPKLVERCAKDRPHATWPKPDPPTAAKPADQPALTAFSSRFNLTDPLFGNTLDWPTSLTLPASRPVLNLTPVYRFTGLAASVSCVGFAANGRRLATGTRDSVDIWDVTTGDHIQTLKSESFYYAGSVYYYSGNALAFHPKWTNVIATRGRFSSKAYKEDGALLWNLDSGKVYEAMESHRDTVNAMAFSPDGQRLATASDDGTVKLWYVSSGSQDRELYGHRGSTNCLAFSADGALLVTGSDDKTVKIWSAYSGTEKKSLAKFEYSVRSLCFAPDGKTVAVAALGVKLIDVEDGRERQSFDGSWLVAISPDGQLLATDGDNGQVYLYDLASGKLLQTLQAHQEGVRSLAFSPDGKWLATGGADRTARLWEIKP